MPEDHYFLMLGSVVIRTSFFCSGKANNNNINSAPLALGRDGEVGKEGVRSKSTIV